jgi:hypothetical protein
MVRMLFNVGAFLPRALPADQTMLMISQKTGGGDQPTLIALYSTGIG